MSLWRKLLSSRSVDQASKIWHANKLTSPSVRAWLQYTHSTKVAWYNLMKRLENGGESNGGRGMSTVKVPFMVCDCGLFGYVLRQAASSYAPLQVTKGNKLRLQQLGYSEVEVARLKPAVALGILEENVPPAEFAQWLPIYEWRKAREAESAKMETTPPAAASPPATSGGETSTALEIAPAQPATEESGAAAAAPDVAVSPDGAPSATATAESVKVDTK